jgi:RNA polymerase sigma-70 factor (ECF subfamily)
MNTELVQRARDGDQGAFEALAESVADRLYTTAALVLHDRTLAEDAVQETLIRTWRSLPRLRDAARFDAWQRRILVHACLDLAQRERHSRSEHELTDTLAADVDIESVAATRDAVSQAFATLTPAHRAAFVLRHYFGHPVVEVADALHVPLGTAKSRIHYAEQAMARAMEVAGEPAALGGVA